MNKNTLFYAGQTNAAPNLETIDQIHANWSADYDKLEANHNYIQWLFPISGSSGVNPRAQALQKAEAQAIMSNPASRARFMKSYKMMLGFYGMRLVDESTGKVQRAANWSSRYSNLTARTHNNLRITRIIQCMGEMPGMAYLQVPFLEHLIHEIVQTKALRSLLSSCKNYWLMSIADPVAIQRLYQLMP
ncbi:opioid growth factor receptor-like [Sycon ciliatum]|uniref:opioid growth factor receptor-like n=1 Tax=Sycon ciliatum TaxID=27933 RepID=UPI0020AC3057|eukprot:scpid100740/ scgid22760/ Opioid growth factor receptor; Zeta-type opioid receptor